MVKLDAQVLRYMTKDEFRVLTAVEMGMKNHEIVSTELIARIAGLKKGGVGKCINSLHRNKLLFHDAKKYDGYRLTYVGYDYLALKTLVSRGMIAGLGQQIGVGKESDIYEVVDDQGQSMVLKIHRLGRTSFRSIKNNRDYLQHRQSASWLYLSRIAATREFAYMKALYERNFPVPIPYDQNRHCVLMSKVNAYPLSIVSEIRHPGAVYSDLMSLIVCLAQHGLIHGDFNEFNLLINDDEEITLIDFPQMVSTSHENAEYYFDRDVQCIRTYWLRRYQYDSAEWPKLVVDTENLIRLDVEIEASGFDKEFARLTLDGRDDDDTVSASEESDSGEDDVDEKVGSDTDPSENNEESDEEDLESGSQGSDGEEREGDAASNASQGEGQRGEAVLGSRARKRRKPKSVLVRVKQERKKQQMKEASASNRRLYRRNTAQTRRQRRAIREALGGVEF